MENQSVLQMARATDALWVLGLDKELAYRLVEE